MKDYISIDKEELTFKSVDELLSIRKETVRNIQILEQQVKVLLQQLSSFRSVLNAVDELLRTYDDKKK